MAEAGLALTMGLVAAPPLTTVQDVLYKADGTRFNGTAVISWRSFEATDSSAITMHNLTVKIADGQLRVRLVPNAGVTPAAYYSVRYSSDGKIQFEETWSVPSSTSALRLRDVRVMQPAAVEAAPTSIQESDVVGLTADLNARPMRGPGYAPGRAAVIAVSGTIEAATGDPADCVRVDGSSGPCGSGGVDLGFTDNESPAGAVDGANANFTLEAAPQPASSLSVYRNGMLLKAEQDYSVADRAITFLAGAIPQPGDTLLASYRMRGSGAGTPTGASLPEVLCSGTGASTTAAEESSLGACDIAAGTLKAGDRVEVRFDYAHGGTQSSFDFILNWGGTTVVSRSAGAQETLVTGRCEAGVAGDGTQIGVQSWGGTLAVAAGVAVAPNLAGDAVKVDFRGRLTAAGEDSLALKNFTVVRYPAP
jgi:hypothetical protein